MSWQASEIITWRYKSWTCLPHHVFSGRVVTLGHTFIITGGYDYNVRRGPLDKIIQFNADEETWTIREETLTNPTYDHVAVLVSEEGYNFE